MASFIPLGDTLNDTKLAISLSTVDICLCDVWEVVRATVSTSLTAVFGKGSTVATLGTDLRAAIHPSQIVIDDMTTVDKRAANKTVIAFLKGDLGPAVHISGAALFISLGTEVVDELVTMGKCTAVECFYDQLGAVNPVLWAAYVDALAAVDTVIAFLGNDLKATVHVLEVTFDEEWTFASCAYVVQFRPHLHYKKLARLSRIVITCWRVDLEGFEIGSWSPIIVRPELHSFVDIEKKLFIAFMDLDDTLVPNNVWKTIFCYSEDFEDLVVAHGVYNLLEGQQFWEGRNCNVPKWEIT